MKEHTLRFKFKGQNYKFKFTAEEDDYWMGFTSRGKTFDVHYCEDYNDICVYAVVGREAQTDETIYKQAIK